MTARTSRRSGRMGGAWAAVVAVALLSPAWFAQAEVIDITWQEGGRFERTVTVAPGKFAELCGALRMGQAVNWSFEADAALNFNIHYHAGKDVRYPSQQDQVLRARGELTVDSDQHYCWMWVNKSVKPAKLALALAMK